MIIEVRDYGGNRYTLNTDSIVTVDEVRNSRLGINSRVSLTTGRVLEVSDWYDDIVIAMKPNKGGRPKKEQSDETNSDSSGEGNS